MTPDIYTPPNVFSLENVTSQQIRLGIQGFPGTGKTWAALTFPNPIVLNLDRGLGAHVGRKDVLEIPFYRSDFCGKRSELKDRLVLWLEKEGKKLTAAQTLVFDGCTSLEIAYHQWFAANQMSFLTKTGKVDDFAEWQVKKKYFGELHELFKELACNVVFISHEAERADKPTTVGQPGAYTGKIRPLLTGAYGDIICRDYTDWFRQHASDKPTEDKLTPEFLANWKMTKAEFQNLMTKYPRNTFYFWQTEGSDLFDGKCSSLVNYPRFMPAEYGSFEKYKRKATSY